MKKLKDRKRFVNVNNLTDEQVSEIQDILTKKVSEIVDRACEDANKILNIYGIKTKMKIFFEEITNN